MISLWAIGWFIIWLLSIWFIFAFVGMSGLVNMFPEGRRWWQFPVQLASIFFFGIMCIIHPFGG